MTEKAKVLKSVDDTIERVRTKSLDLSFNELLDMYDDDELLITPDYQRLFRWSEEKQSRLIESLILEMPIPPIFVIERQEGVYELIDGLQRVSSYLHFRGKMLSEEAGKKYDSPLELKGCDIVTDLNGLNYKDLPKTLQIRLKRSFVRVEVLRKESDQRLRYYMFKRLNTGGEMLSDQEIRNCTIRLLGTDFNEFIIECSNNEYFKNTIKNISDDKIHKKYDQELVLRYFAIKNNLSNYENSLDAFMTKYMEKVTTGEVDFDFEKEKETFKNTFHILSEALGKNTFATLLDNEEKKYRSDFLMYNYDAFTAGLEKVQENINITDEEIIEDIKNTLEELKEDEDFLKYKTGGEANTRNRIQIVEDRIGDII